MQTGAVPVAHLKQMVAEQDIQIKPADILFIRVGFTAAYDRLTTQDQENFPTRDPPGLLGLEATKESLRWLWENRFAAVASDSPSFERGPVGGPYNDPDVTIHQWALAGWGLPLGEMFDLEETARLCYEMGRHSFFVTSAPLKASSVVLLACVAVEIDFELGSWRGSKPAERYCNILGAIVAMQGLVDS
jgi:hypothetical protein